MKHFIAFALLFFGTVTSFAQETIDVMFYNLLEFPSALPTNRPQILQSIISEYDPEIFMVCELENSNGNNILLDIVLNGANDFYDGAAYIENQSSDSPLQQNLYFKKDKFELVAQNVIITSVRDINSYVLELKTENQAIHPIQLYVYVSHLKSSQGSANEALRLEAVTALIDELETIPEDAFVIFAGDFNVYDAEEPAYLTLLEQTNNITFIDPIDSPGDWNNNEAFTAIHTQSTRVSSSEFGAGAGGGLDDRFDFILMSQNMVSNPQLHYVEGTYKAYGNNGNCYNLDINDTTCEGAFSAITRNNLYSMSDHLPIVMTLETEESFLLNTTPFASTLGIFLEQTQVTNTLQFLRTMDWTQPLRFTVYNALGQEVYQNTVPSKQQSFFSVDMLEKGMYYIKFTQVFHPNLKFIKM